jgi:hypothetical protein
VGGCQAVAAPADDDDVIGALGLRISLEEIGVIGQVCTRRIFTHVTLHRTVMTNRYIGDRAG